MSDPPAPPTSTRESLQARRRRGHGGPPSLPIETLPSLPSLGTTIAPVAECKVVSPERESSFWNCALDETGLELNLVGADKDTWIGLQGLPIGDRCWPVLTREKLKEMKEITSFDGAQIAGAMETVESFVKLYDLRTVYPDSKRSHFAECAYVCMRFRDGNAPPSLISVRSAGVIDNMLAIEMPRCEVSCRGLLRHLCTVYPRDLCQRLILAQEKPRTPKPTGDPVPRGMKRSASWMSQEEFCEMLMECTRQVYSSAKGCGGNDPATMRAELIAQPSSPTSTTQSDLSVDDVGHILKDWMNGAGSTPTPEDLLWVLAFDVATALDHLHTKFFLWHNDVKPDNILIALDRNDKNQSELRFVLCDFGSAVPVDRGGLCVSPEKIGNRGTHLFFGPEVASRCWSPRFSVKSDVWGLGVTLLELALGQVPSTRMSQESGDRIRQCDSCLALPLYDPGGEAPGTMRTRYQCACGGALLQVTGVNYRSHEIFHTVLVADVEAGLELLETRGDHRSPLRHSKEFRDFLKAILVHDPNNRPTASAVLEMIPQGRKPIPRVKAFQGYRFITDAQSRDRCELFPELEPESSSPTSTEQSRLFWQQRPLRVQSFEGLDAPVSRGEED